MYSSGQIPSHVHYAGDLCQADHDAWLLSIWLRSWLKSFWRPSWLWATVLVVLGLQDGAELDAGLEVGAGFADGLEGAVELGRAGAPAVAEQPVVLAAQPGHLGAGRVGGQLGGPAAEGTSWTSRLLPVSITVTPAVFGWWCDGGPYGGDPAGPISSRWSAGRGPWIL